MLDETRGEKGQGFTTDMGLDEGVLALISDGCIKDLAYHLQVSPQRVHQIIVNDPYAAYMRIHRALALACPARAQSMADRFLASHEELMRGERRQARLSTSEALSHVATEGADVLRAELEKLPLENRKRETIEQIRALWEYYDTLLTEEEGSSDAAAPAPGRHHRAFGGAK